MGCKRPTGLHRLPRQGAEATRRHLISLADTHMQAALYPENCITHLLPRGRVYANARPTVTKPDMKLYVCGVPTFSMLQVTSYAVRICRGLANIDIVAMRQRTVGPLRCYGSAAHWRPHVLICCLIAISGTILAMEGGARQYTRPPSFPLLGSNAGEIEM